MPRDARTSSCQLERRDAAEVDERLRPVVGVCAQARTATGGHDQRVHRPPCRSATDWRRRGRAGRPASVGPGSLATVPSTASDESSRSSAPTPRSRSPTTHARRLEVRQNRASSAAAATSVGCRPRRPAGRAGEAGQGAGRDDPGPREPGREQGRDAGRVRLSPVLAPTGYWRRWGRHVVERARLTPMSVAARAASAQARRPHRAQRYDASGTASSSRGRAVAGEVRRRASLAAREAAVSTACAMASKPAAPRSPRRGPGHQVRDRRGRREPRRRGPRTPRFRPARAVEDDRGVADLGAAARRSSAAAMTGRPGVSARSPPSSAASRSRVGLLGGRLGQVEWTLPPPTATIESGAGVRRAAPTRARTAASSGSPATMARDRRPRRRLRRGRPGRRAAAASRAKDEPNVTSERPRSGARRDGPAGPSDAASEPDARRQVVTPKAMGVQVRARHRFSLRARTVRSTSACRAMSASRGAKSVGAGARTARGRGRRSRDTSCVRAGTGSNAVDDGRRPRSPPRSTTSRRC